MNRSSNIAAFKKVAEKPEQKRKAIPPLSIRLNAEEREMLVNAAGSMTIAAYVRLKLFDESEVPTHRKAYVRKKTTPTSELTMIAHILGCLGESGIASSLNDIAKAAKIGALPVTSELENEVHNACDAVQEIRVLLISAMGVKAR